MSINTIAQPVKSFFLWIWNRWKDEYVILWETRRVFWDTSEYKWAIGLSLLPLLSVPAYALFHWSFWFTIFGFLFSFFWLVGIGIVTAWWATLDNIPFLSDSSSVMNALDWLGFEKIKALSSTLEKKKRMENYLEGFIRWLIIYVTAQMYRCAKWLLANIAPLYKPAIQRMLITLYLLSEAFKRMNESFDKGNLLKVAAVDVIIIAWRLIVLLWYIGMFCVSFSSRAFAYVLFVFPIVWISVMWFYWVLAGITPTIAKIPALLSATVSVGFIGLLLYVMMWLVNFPEEYGLFLFSLVFFAWYASFFLNREDIWMMREAYSQITGGHKVEFQKF